MTEAGRNPWYDADGRPFAPYIVGVAGGSASGKTSIAKEVIHRLPKVPWVAIVSQDAFYRPLSPDQVKLAFDQNFDFDHPNAIDQELLVQCIRNLKASRAVQIPVYSFTQHQRTSASTYLYGHAVIVVEGLFVLQDPELRELLDLKIFVQTDPDIMLARRIRRDIVDRGRSIDGVLDQYLRFVKPSFETFVAPSARHADIIVPGANNAVAIDVISQHIAKHLLHTRNLVLSAEPHILPESLESTQYWPFQRARIRVGIDSTGQTVHCVEHEPFSADDAPSSFTSETTTLLPLPPNVDVLRQTPQMRALLTIMHDAATPAGEFAWACKRVGAFVVEEAMKQLPYEERSVPLHAGGTYVGLKLNVDFICGVSILRSGAILEHVRFMTDPASAARPPSSISGLCTDSEL